MSGLNLYQYKEPSNIALLCVAQEMLKGHDPFFNLGCMYRILNKQEIKNSPKDYFVLKAFFLQVKFGAGLSSHNAKIYNFLDAIGKEKGKSLATTSKLIQLLSAYMTEGKNHHSNYEIMSAVFSIRKNKNRIKILRDGQKRYQKFLKVTDSKKRSKGRRNSI